MLTELIAFTALVAALVAIPGPAVLLIIKSTVLRGQRAALLVAVGVLFGDLIWAAAAVAGITALVVASHPIFTALRFAGAAYLIYLGIRLFLARETGRVIEDTPAEARPHQIGRAFREGLLCEMSNPKTLIIFTSVIPQFLPHHASAGDVGIFGALFAILGFLSLLVYVTVLGFAGRRFSGQSRLKTALLRASGAVLALFGVGLVVDQSA